MQKASKSYRESMKKPLRHRGYIRVRIGVINEKAQESINVYDERNDFAFITDKRKPFEGFVVDNVYATCEEDFSRVDGTMYFPPIHSKNVAYNNGLVSNDLFGTFYFNFENQVDLDIKGLTIDFGDCYPTEFTVTNNESTRTYTNNSRHWSTEDVFNGTSFIEISALSMVNGNGRLRIYQFECGITNVFTGNEVKNYTLRDYVSSICETIPSVDMTVTIDNQSMYYNVDNPDSPLAYLEQGQEIIVEQGYDVDGKGKIEWIKYNKCYLKSWTSTDTEAKFTAVDRFDYQLTDKYYRGFLNRDGVSAYDLALDVLTDGGITDPRDYYIDPYMKNVVIINPIPVVKHSEALQLLANASRCVLTIDRDGRISIKSSFRPEDTVSVNNQTSFSKIDKLTQDTVKQDYALTDNNYSQINNSMYFMPYDIRNANLECGYVSESVYREKIGGRLPFRFGGEKSFTLLQDGEWEGATPEITISFDNVWTCYGLKIVFRSNAPKQFTIRTYSYNELTTENVVKNNEDLIYIGYDEYDSFNKMVITFDKGYPNSRLFVDNIIFGDVTDYTLSRTFDIQNSPTGVRQHKYKSITVNRTVWGEDDDSVRDLSTNEIVVPRGNSEQIVYFSNPAYNLSAEFREDEIPETPEEGRYYFTVPKGMTIEIADYSNYYAKVVIKGSPNDDFTVKFAVVGNEYIDELKAFTKSIYGTGDTLSWTNPLISETQHAKQVEEWLEDFYLGDVDYNIKWRGDPRVDANDMFYLELQDGTTTLIRCYENQLTFNGAWSSIMKARKSVF